MLRKLGNGVSRFRINAFSEQSVRVIYIYIYIYLYIYMYICIHKNLRGIFPQQIPFMRGLWDRLAQPPTSINHQPLNWTVLMWGKRSCLSWEGKMFYSCHGLIRTHAFTIPIALDPRSEMLEFHGQLLIQMLQVCSESVWSFGFEGRNGSW